MRVTLDLTAGILGMVESTFGRIRRFASVTLLPSGSSLLRSLAAARCDRLRGSVA